MRPDQPPNWLDRLKKLTDPQFDELVERLQVDQVDPSLLPSAKTPLTERAIALLHLCQQSEEQLARLHHELEPLPAPSLASLLIERLGRSPRADAELGRLLHALLEADAFRRGFEYRVHEGPGARIIDGIAPNGIPGLNGPMLFSCLPTETPPDTQQIERRLKKIRLYSPLKSPRHFVLVTFDALTPELHHWLAHWNPRKRKGHLHIWDSEHLIQRLHGYPALLARYAPELVRPLLPDCECFDFHGFAEVYRTQVALHHERLRTLGLPPETLRERDSRPDVRLRDIFVPLRLIPHDVAYAPQLEMFANTPPERRPARRAAAVELARVLANQGSAVVLGDPGTGKSTLLRFLALLFSGAATLNGFTPDAPRVPLFISLRDFVCLQKERPDLSLLTYLEARARSDLQLPQAHRAFFEAALRMDEAVVLLDGLDEVGGTAARQRVARAIEAFRHEFPRSRLWVSSRIYSYTADVRLPATDFAHYRLAPLDDQAVEDFVTRWYRVQLDLNLREREDCTASLQQAIKRTQSVRRLAGNPLLLTLMAFIHHGLRRLPQDRGELYEKCIEMLLRSWQDAKREEDAGTMSMVERLQLPLHTQKDYLGHLALRIQESTSHGDDEAVRGLISRQEAIACLAGRHLEVAARTRPELTLAQACDEMGEFIDYLSDRTGLLIDRGGEILSFVHLSFQEYLAAWVHTCIPETPEQRSAFFEKHLGAAAWEEVLLLRLYVILRTTGGGGENAFDAVSSALLRRLERSDSPAGWLTLTRALRDDLAFRAGDIASIVRRALELWAKEPALAGTWFSAIEELCLFSNRGRAAVMARLRSTIEREPPVQAVAALHLFHRLFREVKELVPVLAARPDRSLFLADLVAFLDIPEVLQLLAEHGTAAHWAAGLHRFDSSMLYQTSREWAGAAAATVPLAALRAGWALLIDKTLEQLAVRATLAELPWSEQLMEFVRKGARLRFVAPRYWFSLPIAPLGPAAACAIPHDHPEYLPLAVNPRLRTEWLGRTFGSLRSDHALTEWTLKHAHEWLAPFSSISSNRTVLQGLGFEEDTSGLLADFYVSPELLGPVETEEFFQDFGQAKIQRTFAQASRLMLHRLRYTLATTFLISFGQDAIQAYRDRDHFQPLRKLGIVPEAPDWEEQWQHVLEHSDNDRLAWIWASISSLGFYSDVSMDSPAASCRELQIELQNPLTLPLLLEELRAGTEARHAWNLLARFAAQRIEGSIPVEPLVAWLHRHPHEVFATALAWAV